MQRLKVPLTIVTAVDRDILEVHLVAVLELLIMFYTLPWQQSVSRCVRGSLQQGLDSPGGTSSTCE